MEFEKVLKKRRSIRKYNDKEVSDEDIKKIINSASLAPSAHFRQPWRFKILRSDDKNIIASFMEEYVNYSKSQDESVLKTANIIKEVNTLILVFNSSKENYLMDILSIGACIENMCLAATNLGISSLWIGNCLSVKNKICKHFNISSNLELISALALGYTESDVRELVRKTYDDLVIK